jgi:hypothetical protein
MDPALSLIWDPDSDPGFVIGMLSKDILIYLYLFSKKPPSISEDLKHIYLNLKIFQFPNFQLEK